MYIYMNSYKEKYLKYKKKYLELKLKGGLNRERVYTRLVNDNAISRQYYQNTIFDIHSHVYAQFIRLKINLIKYILLNDYKSQYPMIFYNYFESIRNNLRNEIKKYSYAYFYDILSNILIDIIVYDNTNFNEDDIIKIGDNLLLNSPNNIQLPSISSLLQYQEYYHNNLTNYQKLISFKYYILNTIENNCNNDSYYFNIMRGFCTLNYSQQFHPSEGNNKFFELFNNNKKKITILDIINELIYRQNDNRNNIQNITALTYKYDKKFSSYNTLDHIMAHLMNMPYDGAIINKVYSNIMSMGKTYIIDYQNICMIINEHLKQFTQYDEKTLNDLQTQYFNEFLHNIVINNNAYVIIIYKPSSNCNLNLSFPFIAPNKQQDIISTLNKNFFIIDYKFHRKRNIRTSSYDDYIFWVIAIAFYFMYKKISCDYNPNYNYLDNLILYTNDKQYFNIPDSIFLDTHYKLPTITIQLETHINRTLIKYNDNDNNNYYNSYTNTYTNTEILNIHTIKEYINYNPTGTMKNLIPEYNDFNNLIYTCYTHDPNNKNNIIVDGGNQNFHNLLTEFNYILYPYSPNFYFISEIHTSLLTSEEIINYMFCYRNKYIFDVTNTKLTEYFTPFELIRDYYEGQCMNNFTKFFISNNSKLSGNNILFLTLIKYMQYLKYNNINGSVKKTDIIHHILPPYLNPRIMKINNPYNKNKYNKNK